MANDAEKNVEDILRILVATDNHLGYAESDPIRGDDSFIVFEEILQKAVEEDVDLILLGGDLFHDAVPSQNSMQKCMKLLRKYTFGDKAVSLEFLSDQKQNFHNTITGRVNYEDPNLNISIPVFSIHGNHDDPSGLGRVSSLDLLATTGLVNYFGRWTDLNNVNISPLLLKKGETQLAIYGLSYINDARLARLFESYKVNIERPSEETGEWFHLMVIHQNRADRGPRNFITEEMLPEFLNFVLWGHEHDCRIEPELNVNRDFWVCQPGSSIATSLCQGEALKKHVGLLEVYKSRFRLKALPLETVRPFIFESLNVDEIQEELELTEGDQSNKIKIMAEERIKFLIEKSEELLSGHPKQPTLPLIRLRILYSKEDQMFNAIRFGQAFNSKVANPVDIVTFKRITKTKSSKDCMEIGKSVIETVWEKQDVDANARVEDLVCQYFKEVKKKQLHVLPSLALSEISYRLVERKDNNAAERILKFYKENCIKYLMENLTSQENIGDRLQWFKDQIPKEDLLQNLESNKDIEISSIKYKQIQRDQNGDVDYDEKGNKKSLAEESKLVKTSSRGRGRGKAVNNGPRGRNKQTVPELSISMKSTTLNKQGVGISKCFGKGVGDSKKKSVAVFEISDSE